MSRSHEVAEGFDAVAEQIWGGGPAAGAGDDDGGGGGGGDGCCCWRRRRTKGGGGSGGFGDLHAHISVSVAMREIFEKIVGGVVDVFFFCFAACSAVAVSSIGWGAVFVGWSECAS